MHMFKRYYLVAVGVLWTGLAFAAAEEISRVENAYDVFKQVHDIPEQRIPGWLLKDAEGIAVIPGVIKAGFVIGGRRGKGVLSVRTKDGSWSNPSFVILTGGSVGFQAGVQSTDVILVFKTRRSVEGIVNGKFTLGGDASVAAGPVGRQANAATDVELKAEIYAYSRSRGLFAGVSLDGSVMNIDHDANEEIYGKGTTPRKIFAGKVEVPDDTIVDFRDLIEEQTNL